MALDLRYKSAIICSVFLISFAKLILSNSSTVETVEAALARRLSRRERQRWHRWYRKGEQVRLRALWILEADRPATMAHLRQRRLVQRRLGESLSPTHSVVAPSDAPALIQTLHTLEQYVVLPLTEEKQDEQLLLAPVDVPATAPDLLWMLLCLYRG